MIDALSCIAFAVYFEARGEIDLGQRLVAESVMNRVDSPRYRNDACAVIKRKDQFSWYWDGKPEIIDDPEAYEKSLRIAKQAMNTRREDRILPNTCNFTDSKTVPYWAEKLPAFNVGNQTFYSGDC